MSSSGDDQRFEVVDLFAGPGGLGEGFSAVTRNGRHPFRIALSIEKDLAARETLRFRAFQRRLSETSVELDPESIDPRSPESVLDGLPESCRDLWKEASEEAHALELADDDETRGKVSALLKRVGPDSIVIGGPPCQAYSLVGRARNRGISDYDPADDHRHFLYKEYVSILDEKRPACFVMENVKGLLSARVEKSGVFEQIRTDLEGAGLKGDASEAEASELERGYRLIPFAPERVRFFGDYRPRDFVIRSEQFGVPQARHRVIILGVRRDIAARFESAVGQDLARWVPAKFTRAPTEVAVAPVLAGLPQLRSTISRRSRDGRDWVAHVKEQASLIRKSDWSRYLEGSEEEFLQGLSKVEESLDSWSAAAPSIATVSQGVPGELRKWLSGDLGGAVFNHTARGHMSSDLGRYLYAALFAQVTGRSPKAPDFPEALSPNHDNWKSGKFADRFRVQVAERPASTVTSHISKDGHYFIHPDPRQCRSLTVREAARLQTFPDDYVFFGNRTQQYVQVGNAVPPFLALQIAGVVAEVLDEVER